MAADDGRPGQSPQRRNPFVQALADSWAAIVLVALAVVFILQNRETVSLDLFMLSFRAPMWLAFTIVFLAGVVTSWFVARRRAKRRAE